MFLFQDQNLTQYVSVQPGMVLFLNFPNDQSQTGEDLLTDEQIILGIVHYHNTITTED